MATEAIVLLKDEYQEIRKTLRADERFTATTTVLIENVEHRMTEEELGWFPQVRAGLGRKQLQELGAEIEQARPEAPRRPSQPGAVKKVVKAVTG